jgi:hypothetical protein
MASNNIFNTIKFMKKAILFLLLSSPILYPSELPDSQKNSTWLGYLTNPYIAALVMHICLKPIDMLQTYLYEQYWLTEKERKEIAEEKRIRLEHTKQQVLLMRDPQWKEATLKLQQQEVARGTQDLEVGKHQLQENEILLRRAQREEDSQDAQILQNLINNSSPEHRLALQEEYDTFVRSCIKKRIQTT